MKRLKPIRQLIEPMGSIILMVPDEEGEYYSKEEVDAEIASLKEKILSEVMTELANRRKEYYVTPSYLVKFVPSQEGDLLDFNDAEKIILEKM